MALKIRTPRRTKLEAAEDLLGGKIAVESAYKNATLVGAKMGTHDGYRRVEHRASQRSVERLQAKILMLKGFKTSPTSMDRQACRDLSEKLAKLGKFTGDPQAAYARARKHNLGCEWLAAAARKAPAALAKLWTLGIKSGEVQAAIKYAADLRGIYAGE